MISSTNSDSHSSFNASGFLQNIMAANNVTMSTPTPVASNSGKIPGLESPTDNARDVFCFMEAKAKTPEEGAPVMWGDKPLTKYQSWPSPDITWTNSQETPVSPPAFEKESFSTPVEYVDTNHHAIVDNNGRYVFPCEPPPAPLLHRHHNQHEEQQPPPPLLQQRLDIDQRMLNHVASSQASDQIATIPLPKLDVDDRRQPVCSLPNRNLISLTDSPSSSANEPWKASNDSDYRGGRMPMPPSPPSDLANMKLPQDNIESVDMELSDDEAAESKGEGSAATSRHRRSSFKDEETQLKTATTAAANQVPGAEAQSGTEPQLLLPPPNPWDMMNMHPQGAGDTVPNASSMSEVDFNKMMNNFANPPPTLEPPTTGGGRPPPPPNFPHFQMPPLPGNQPPPHFGGDMQFPRPLMSIPPPPPPTVADSSANFHPRPDFGQPPPPPPNHMQRPPSFGPPFGFMPNPMFMNNGPMGATVTSTPTKEYPQQQQQPQYGHQPESPAVSSANEQGYSSNIEPLVKTRQFDKPEGGNAEAGEDIGALFDRAHEFASNKPMRSNLKEISLSDVLERSMTRSKDEEAQQEDSQTDAANDAVDSAIDNDLFSSVDDIDGNGGNAAGKDDGADDLYNNIDESQADASDNVATNSKKDVDQALAAAVMAAVSSSLAAATTPSSKTQSGNFKFVQNNDFVVYESEESTGGQEGDDGAGDFQTPVKQKTPFQAVMPKVAKSMMAPPPNFMEDDERSPWPLMPVIDLSNEGNEQNSFDEGGFQHFQQNANNAERTNGSPAAFLRQPGKNDFRPRFFGGGDRRFPSPGQRGGGGGGDMRGRGRFSSPRGDFRPRGGFQNQMRMPRTPGQFQQRGPGGANFQNSPRMFKGPRANRPFRRGW